MRTACALVASLALALAARGADEAPAPATRPGDTYQQVIASRGRPASEMAVGTVRILYYADASIKLRDGVVVDVKAVAVPRARAAGQAGAPPAAPGALPPGWTYAGDPVEAGIDGFEKIVLGKFGAGKFSELEVLSAHIIGEKSVFGDGSWKILRFHEALDLPAAEPEEAWKAREDEVSAWEARFPVSITARTVHMRLLSSYARRARGPGSATAAKGFAGSAFIAKLAQAADLYQSAARFDEKSPMLWHEACTVALWQGWPAKDVVARFEEAKRAEPGFWHYDGQVTEFLLPRWYGKEGDWERLAESEIQRGDGLGVEEYARTIYAMSGYYKNIFKESQAQWGLTKEGYDVARLKYGGSMELLNQYAVLAVLAEDKPAARAALEAMKGHADPLVWRGRDLAGSLAWAGGAP
jgi:hypothetical protein